ncbi:MAG: LysM peptidoglycan-binding domain-containing protein [Verrucomicrobiota bacterium]
MNRFAAALLLSATIFSAPRAHAEQADAEDVRRLNGTVEALGEGQESLRKQIQSLKDQLEKVRSENAQLRQELAGNRDMVTREQLNQVVEQLREVDRKRAADAEYVKAQLADIARDVNKSLAAAVKEPVKESPKSRGSTRTQESKPTQESTAPSTPEVKLPDYMYEHVVKPGETLGAIITAYNQEKGLKITTAHVMAANPGLKDPKRIRVGQKLNIPEVK